MSGLEYHELGYYDRNIPCLAACPVHTNAGAYVAAIAGGDDLDAYLTARLPNPLASICGRVCAAPCEDACRRGSVDKPIAIRALKRYVTEKYGVESGPRNHWRHHLGNPPPARPQSVGIVGGGPAGLSAAHDLRRLGYQVTIYEATSELGGMMRLGIPEYRLNRRLLSAEIDAIIALGVEVSYNTRLGKDITLPELRARHDALFLALGATLGRGLDIPGHDGDGVFRAIEFLININRGFRVDIGDRVVVVGGGNVAMDAARTALRAAAYEDARQEEEASERAAALVEAFDVARTAVRAGAKDVTVVALESREEMPASSFEIEEAMAEGIRFVHRRGPWRIELSEGAATALTTVGVTSVFDAEGRFAPVFDQDDISSLEADTVILAIGQAVDVEALGGDGPEVGRRRTIEIDPETMATSVPGIWAGGDAAHGPRNLIDAVADGQRVARSIHRSFGGTLSKASPGAMVEITGFFRSDDLYDRVDRAPVPSLPTDRRIGLRDVEIGFSESEARIEASRCLRCFANIELDIERCVLCGLCADVCPYDLISLVPAAEVDGEGGAGTALLLDESGCIRCGLCVNRCPTEALSMQLWAGMGAVPRLSDMLAAVAQ
jgi:NADPH-dependent glutamate synthase beta subunit-like oxidoreductase